MAASPPHSPSFLLFLDLSQSVCHAKQLHWKPPLTTPRGGSFTGIRRVIFPSVISRVKARSAADGNGGSHGGTIAQEVSGEVEEQEADLSTEGIERSRTVRSMDSISLSIKEPVYEVIEVTSEGRMSTKNISRRQLLKSSGL